MRVVVLACVDEIAKHATMSSRGSGRLGAAKQGAPMRGMGITNGDVSVVA